MKTPWDFFQSSRTKIKNTWKIAFLSAFVLGILIHLPVMLSDIPNHDGLSSMYFDQNMITSGRWFLSVACGFSSYFTIPWIIGLIGLLWLALAAVALTESRPYKQGMPHEKACEILWDMANKGWLDETIVKQVEDCFRG